MDNTIQGNTGDNSLAGFGGDDRLSGGNGGDVLEGRSGADTLAMESGNQLFGGSSSDSFFFDGRDLGSGGSGGLEIVDFDGSAGERLVSASGLKVSSFSYIESAAFSAGGNSEAHFEGGGEFQVDRDSDGTSDITFQLNGVTAAGQISAADFLWPT